MAEEANKSNSAFNIFESTVKVPNDVAIEIIMVIQCILKKTSGKTEREQGKKEYFHRKYRNAAKLE